MDRPLRLDNLHSFIFDMILLVQWNCRGLHNKQTELKNLMNQYDVVCLQETWLGPGDPLSFSGFLSFRWDRPNRVGGGTAVLCRPFLDPSIIQLADIETLGLELSAVILNNLFFSNKRLAIVSLYRPPNVSLGDQGWGCFFKHMKSISDKYSLIICGDFNTHHSAWGSSLTNPEGLIMANLLASSDLIFLNNGAGTRMSACSSHNSVPDLTLCSISLSGLCSWSLMDDALVKLCPLVRNIRRMLYFLHKDGPGSLIRFFWCPAHCGVRGNERADAEAKTAAISGQSITNKVDYRQLISHFSDEYSTIITILSTH